MAGRPRTAARKRGEKPQPPFTRPASRAALWRRRFAEANGPDQRFDVAYFWYRAVLAHRRRQELPPGETSRRQIRDAGMLTGLAEHLSRAAAEASAQIPEGRRRAASLARLRGGLDEAATPDERLAHARGLFLWVGVNLGKRGDEESMALRDRLLGEATALCAQYAEELTREGPWLHTVKQA